MFQRRIEHQLHIPLLKLHKIQCIEDIDKLFCNTFTRNANTITNELKLKDISVVNVTF